MNRRNFINMTVFSCVALILPGCSTKGVMTDQPEQKGPPPHAPAHGYRRKNRDELTITYDSNVGVYFLLNYPMHYYWDGKYYRKNKNKWESTKDINKKWKKIKKQKLPKGLKSK